MPASTTPIQPAQGPDAVADSSLRLRFVVPEFVTHMGSRLAIVGSLPALGAWDAAQALDLSWAPGHRWAADLELPRGWTGTVEFKVSDCLLSL